MGKFKIGDMVIMKRVPTEEEWESIGEVDVPNVLYQISHKILDFDSKAIMLDCSESCQWFPACCFELMPTSPSKKDRLIAEARVKYPKGTFFYSAESGRRGESFHEYEYDESNDRLTDDGWAVYYKGKWAKVDGGITSSKFKVGDKVIGNVKTRGRYAITIEGWIGEVKKVLPADNMIEVYGKGLENRSHVDEDCFDLYKEGSHISLTIKTSENGKAKHDDSERVIKVSQPDFEVSRGNQIRGSRINGSASEVSIGNRHRYYEARPNRG